MSICQLSPHHLYSLSICQPGKTFFIFLNEEFSFLDNTLLFGILVRWSAVEQYCLVSYQDDQDTVLSIDELAHSRGETMYPCAFTLFLANRAIENPNLMDTKPDLHTCQIYQVRACWVSQWNQVTQWGISLQELVKERAHVVSNFKPVFQKFPGFSLTVFHIHFLIPNRV